MVLFATLHTSSCQHTHSNVCLGCRSRDTSIWHRQHERYLVGCGGVWLDLLVYARWHYTNWWHHIHGCCHAACSGIVVHTD